MSKIINYTTYTPRGMQATAKANNIASRNNIRTPFTHVISFGNASKKNPDQVSFLAAEIGLGGQFKLGGLASVIKDYFDKFAHGPDGSTDGRVFIPYYNGYTPSTEFGEIVDGAAAKLRVKNGEVVHTITDPNKSNFFLLKQNDILPLEEVTSSKITYPDGDKDVKLFTPKDPKLYHRLYYVYTDITTSMPEPYKLEGKQMAYGSDSKMPMGIDPYAIFDRAYVELVPKLDTPEMGKYRFNPKHHLLSEAHTFYIPHEIARLRNLSTRNITNNKDHEKEYKEKERIYQEYWKGATVSSVGHNQGAGYQGVISPKGMFYAMATPEEADIVHQDPVFKQKAMQGNTDNYFKPFIKAFLDANKSASASMIPIRYAQIGEHGPITTVSEGYGESAKENPRVANGLTPFFKELAQRGLYGGILNPFGDKSYSPSVKLPETSPEMKNKMATMPLYNGIFKDENTGVTHTPMEAYSKDDPIDKILAARRKNAVNLMQRFKEGADPKYAVGLSGKKVKIIGAIDQKWIDHVADPKNDYQLFISWGRGDLQKGHDLTLKAFAKFAKTEEGKNSILILGGDLMDNNPESKVIRDLMKQLLEDKDLKGRLVFMDGFAPNKPFAAAGDGIFPSRFAPCELTDLEAMKYGSTPIVVNTQGLAQKNFDARIPEEADRATGYKTKHEFYMDPGELEELEPQFYDVKRRLVENEMVKLEAASVDENARADIAVNKVKNSEDYQKAMREYADNILVDEIAECMKAKVTESPETREKLIRNCLNVKTDWEDNQALHPSGKTTLQLYKELHFDFDSKTPATTLFDPDNELARVKARVDEANKFKYHKDFIV